MLNNKKEKKKINDVVEECFDGSIIKPSKDINKSDLEKKLGIFDISIYDNMFEPQIRKRGQEYFTEHKIKNVKNSKQKWNCEVYGTKKYNTSIEFDKEDENKILNVQCECQYYLDNNKNCKHIYALLTRVKCANNLAVITEEITDYSNRMVEIIKKENEYLAISSEKLQVSIEDISRFNGFMEQLQLTLQRMAKLLEDNCCNEDILLDEFVNVIKASYNFNNCFEDFILKVTKKENPTFIQNDIEEQEQNSNFEDSIIDIIVINEIEKNKRKNKNKGNNF